jgi:hypothetical protein
MSKLNWCSFCAIETEQKLSTVAQDGNAGLHFLLKCLIFLFDAKDNRASLFESILFLYATETWEGWNGNAEGTRETSTPG